MKKRNQRIALILAAVFFVLLQAAAGAAYYVLTRETGELNSELESLTSEKNRLTEKVNQLQTSVDAKNAEVVSESKETESQKTESTLPEAPVPVKGLVAIDPGHQGSWVDMSELEPNAPGSSELKAKATTGTEGSFTGIAEYELNLDISLMLAEELRVRGYQVLLAREDHDTSISNAQRAVKANEAGADIAVRIHANGSEDPSANGALTMTGSPDNPYIGHLYEQSNRLAADILDNYCSATGLANAGMLQTDNMTGLNWSTIPAVILEMGFMTNESDDRNMADPAFREKMVQGIADGIDAYFTAN